MLVVQDYRFTGRIRGCLRRCGNRVAQDVRDQQKQKCDASTAAGESRCAPAGEHYSRLGRGDQRSFIRHVFRRATDGIAIGGGAKCATHSARETGGVGAPLR